MSWQVGLTRVYFVLWGLWFLFCCYTAAVGASNVSTTFGLTHLAILLGIVLGGGIVLPWLLLLILRWVTKGFTS